MVLCATWVILDCWVQCPGLIGSTVYMWTNMHKTEKSMFISSRNNKEMKRTIKRLAFSVTFPLIALWQYWYSAKRDGDYSTNQLLLASAIAIVVAAAIFLYVPIAKKVERWSIAWWLGLMAIMFLGATAIIIHWLYEAHRAWSHAVIFFTIWIPVIHGTSKHLDTKVK